MLTNSVKSNLLRRVSGRSPRVGVLGAALGTGNLGVDALGISMVQGLVTAIPEVQIVYQAWDLRHRVLIPLGEEMFECEPLALRRRGSIRHRDGLQQIRKIAKLRRWLAARSIPTLPTFSKTLKQLLSCDAILDVSAGDSFATIYGEKVFWYQTQIKLVCLELGLPLVLMPQTYGPFDNEAATDVASNILSRAAMVCSREDTGLEEVKSLCGDHTPQQLIRVPDMAFLLEPRKTTLPKKFEQAGKDDTIRIALNISGLLYFDGDSFQLKSGYRQLTRLLVEWALSIPNSRVLLVPHVIVRGHVPGSNVVRSTPTSTTDTDACEELISQFRDNQATRVDILREHEDPAQAKYAMSQCDYFVGARMHAFIGSVSQCVPGTLLAYSKKADGLANLLGIGDNVVDMRELSAEACLAAVKEQYQRRHETTAHLARRVPVAKAELLQFFRDKIAPLVIGTKAPVSNPNFLHDTTNLHPENSKALH